MGETTGEQTLPEALGAPPRLTKAIEAGADRVWRVLKLRPYLGIAVAAGAGLLAAYTVGPAELAIAIAAGYAAYQVLTLKLPPSQALRNAARIEQTLAV
jgi:hypothetical protein